jgi:predicted GTPase
MTRLLDLAFKVEEERNRHIDYNALNRVLKGTIISKRPLQNYGPASPRIFDAAQVGDAPPRFLLTVHGEKENLHENWMKYFAKRLRLKFGFEGTPIEVIARNVPPAKSKKKHNVHGLGMEAVAGRIREKKILVNQTRRRQKKGFRRY